MSDNKMNPKQFRLTRQQNLLVKRLAKERGVSESEVMRQALVHELQRARLAETKPKGS
jgi:hypothetical protein